MFVHTRVLFLKSSDGSFKPDPVWFAVVFSTQEGPCVASSVHFPSAESPVLDWEVFVLLPGYPGEPGWATCEAAILEPGTVGTTKPGV